MNSELLLIGSHLFIDANQASGTFSMGLLLDQVMQFEVHTMNTHTYNNKIIISKTKLSVAYMPYYVDQHDHCRVTCWRHHICNFCAARADKPVRAK